MKEQFFKHPSELKKTNIDIGSEIEQIATHGGRFHADEVFAEAILKDLFPETIHETNGRPREKSLFAHRRVSNRKEFESLKKHKSVLVIDAGEEYNLDNNNIDHHQPGGAGARENGVKYATAGLVWERYGREWLKYIDVYTRGKEHIKKSKPEKLTPSKATLAEAIKQFEAKERKELTSHINFLEKKEREKLSDAELDIIWKKIDETYVQFIDSRDTGQLTEIDYVLDDGKKMTNQQFTMAECVRLYNVDCHDGRSHEERFFKATEVFRDMVLAMANKYIDLIEDLRKYNPENTVFSSDGKTAVIKDILNTDAIGHLLDNDPSFKNVEYYASASKKGTYFVHVAPTSEGLRSFRNPAKIPDELRLGNKPADIGAILGTNDIIFVHQAGHMAECKTQEAAEKLLEYCANKK